MQNRASISVLLIDDQRFIGMAVGRLLATEPDMALHCCYSAKDAIADATRLTPSVILQDLVLPDIDGITLVDMFRKNAATATTPIVVLSGNDDPASRARATAAGANDYLIKLPGKDVLIECIRRHASGGAATAPPPAAAASTSSPDVVTLDAGVLASLRDGMGPAGATLVAKLIDQFIQEATLLVDRLSHAASQCDASVLKASSHSLKGTCGTIGARRLAALASQVEDHVDRQGNAAVDAALVTAICEELGSVRRACLAEQVASTAANGTRT